MGIYGKLGHSNVDSRSVIARRGGYERPLSNKSTKEENIKYYKSNLKSDVKTLAELLKQRVKEIERLKKENKELWKELQWWKNEFGSDG